MISVGPAYIYFGGWIHPTLKLRVPVRLQVELEENTVCVSWAEIDEFGYGQTLSAALDDFGSSLGELYMLLNRPNVRLSKYLQNVKQVLSVYIDPLVGI